MQISKSDYITYLKHPAWLWLKKNDKNKLPPVDDALQSIFDAGYLFESYAEKLFPDGIKLNWEGYQEYLDLPQRTNEAIFSGAKTIFQGRFEVGEITCITDVIVFKDKDTLDLYEIKSSSSAKTYHEHDLAFQTIVLEDSGYNVDNIAVIHVNKDFVRNGDIDIKEFTAITDVTTKVRKRIDVTREKIKDAIETAKLKEMPDTSPSKCGLSSTSEWIEIYKLLMGIENGDGSIYDIYNPSATLISKLEEAGIKLIHDIPLDFDGLSDKQRWQVKALKTDQIFSDTKRIHDFMSQIEYPIYFLDYESLSSVVPYFDNHKPYQDIPFQYSLHIIDSPGAEIRHTGYLHSENSDPVRLLSESLMQNIGPKGSVLVWWESFEKGRNDDMGVMLPEFKKFYKELNGRVIDLITPFFDFYYVDKRFGGSASIKDVLPVLVPELSHKDLDISEGRAAQRLWMEAILDDKRPVEKEKILKDLWDYCKLDTLAMVKIWEFLSKL